MQKSFRFLSVVLLSATAYANYERPHDTPVAVDAVTETRPVVTDADVDDTLRCLFDAGLGSADAYDQLLILQAQVAQWASDRADEAPGLSQVGVGLQAAIEAVIASARAGFMTHFEAAFLREQVIEARLDVVLEQLIQRARATGWDPDVYETVVAPLRARAAAAVGYPDPESARIRLQAILDQLRDSAQFRNVNLDSLRLELLRTRVMSYFEFLVRRARTLGVTREQAMPIIHMVYERARLIAHGS